MKICANCRYVDIQYGAMSNLCTHPKAILHTSIVTGEKSCERCCTFRGVSRPCGKEGTLYEPHLSIWKKIKLILKFNT